MIFIIGGKEQGKLNYALNEFNLDINEVIDFKNSESKNLYDKKIYYNFHEYIKYLTKNYNKDTLEYIKSKIPEINDKIIISNEIGCGVVPIGNFERKYRQINGKVNIIIAQNAKKVIRVFCGIPQIIKE